MGDSDLLAIDFEFRGMLEAIAQVRKLAQLIKRLPKRVTIEVDIVQRVRGAVSGAVRRASRAAGSARTLALPDPNRTQRVSAARMQKLFATPPAYRYRGPKPPKYASKPGFGKLLGDAFMSSRFSMENGHIALMPLIGRTIKALSALGPEVMIAVAVIAAAVVGLNELVKACGEAAKSLTEFARARFTSGGSMGEMAQASRVGALMGLSPGDMAQQAMALSQRLTSDPFAMATGQGMGIRDMPGPFGAPDKMKNFLKALDAITDTRISDKQALITARQIGMEQYLYLRQLSDLTRMEIKADALVQKRIYSPDQQRSALEFTTQLGRMTESFKNLGMVFLGPPMRVLSTAFEVAANVVNIFADGLKQVYDFMGRLPGVGTLFHGPADPNKAANDREKAVRDNTQALYEMNGTMRQIFGGGERARGAMPASLRGQAFSDGLAHQAIKLGAFAL